MSARSVRCGRLLWASKLKGRGGGSLQEFHEVFPHLVTATDVPRLVKTGDVRWDDVDAAFCCLPHATTQVRTTT